MRDTEIVNRFQAVKELLGHDVKVEQRKVNGRVIYYKAVCSCGYESSEFKNSPRTATGAGIGHAKRVADRLRFERDGVSFPEGVGGRQ